MEELWDINDAKEREHMLICPPPGMARDEIESLLADDFCEVGASGKIHSREEGIGALVQRVSYPTNESWQTTDYELRRLSENICLATYVLDWRLARGKTRRSTIWRREGGAWRAVYHQGTRCEP